ncbi:MULTISPECIES: hypothetical protein [Geobacillus]|uniref:hypothetical protein n=1 Tax=Geobacillus TaxID=129337 RepID=UPI0010564089|nr:MULTISPECIES: hypothetical protein [Geobacillus]
MKTERLGKGQRFRRGHRRCFHRYEHLETKKQVFEDEESGIKSWRRVDLFYCQRCLWIKERVFKTISQNEPDWY